MGGGSWDTKKFADYTIKTKKVNLKSDGSFGFMSHQEVFKAKSLSDSLNPYKAMRECRDSAEHPNTIPVILALDVTGSMGQAAVECASKLNVIITKLFNDVKDVEFMIMGIGDFKYDQYPLQASQFESDIRIAEQLDELYFEFGGGGNDFESYSAAWYFGLHNTDLDCTKRGQKGIIITMGDETLNPYIPKNGSKTSFNATLGETIQDDIDTKELYEKASEKFDIYHINVNHRYYLSKEEIEKSFSILGQRVITCTIDELAETITDIIKSNAAKREDNNDSFIANVETEDEPQNTSTGFFANTDESGRITW